MILINSGGKPGQWHGKAHTSSKKETKNEPDKLFQSQVDVPNI